MTNKLYALITAALGFLDYYWLILTLHFQERHHAYADIGHYLSNWDVYKTTETWFLLSFAMFTLTSTALCIYAVKAIQPNL